MRNVARHVIFTTALGLLIAMFLGVKFYFVDGAHAMGRERLIQKAAFTALREGRARINVSNFGTKPVGVVMRLVNLDDRRKDEESVPIVIPPGGGAAAPDSFFDAGECRYRAEVDVAAQGPHALGISVQFWDSDGDTQLFFDEFESFRTLAP